MAKRFIDTDIFKKQFIRGLEAPYKLLWIYILNDCNYAGIWEVDFEVAEIRLGVKVEKEKAIKIFQGKIRVLNEGSKWFFPDFITFQYGALQETNRAHKNIISLLLKEGIINQDLSLKPLTSPLKGAKEKEQEKEMEMEKETEQEKGENPEILEPELSPTFEDFWHEYDKKKGSIQKLKTKWDRLSQREREDIMEYIPNYKLSQPDKQYRLNAETFLNNKSWNDELIFKNNGNKHTIGTQKNTTRVENTSYGPGGL